MAQNNRARGGRWNNGSLNSTGADPRPHGTDASPPLPEVAQARHWPQDGVVRTPESLPTFLGLQETLAGRYSLERELGRGGMGLVYLAHEVALDRPVALKLLPPAMSSAPALRERILREARTAAKLSHPNIVPIYAVDEARDFVFFAMAYVDGGTLGERIRQQGPLKASEATRMLREMAWALAYAHEPRAGERRGRGRPQRPVRPGRRGLLHPVGPVPHNR
jgi:serine/threonine protein kinase